jgi:hypothetical protein
MSIQHSENSIKCTSLQYLNRLNNANPESHICDALRAYWLMKHIHLFQMEHSQPIGNFKSLMHDVKQNLPIILAKKSRIRLRDHPTNGIIIKWVMIQIRVTYKLFKWQNPIVNPNAKFNHVPFHQGNQNFDKICTTPMARQLHRLRLQVVNLQYWPSLTQL